MASVGKIIVLIVVVLLSFSPQSSERKYTFGELWGGDIELPEFPFGIKDLNASIVVRENETVCVRIFSSGEVTLTIRVGKKQRREVVGNNETISITARENVSNISLRFLNTKGYSVTLFKNSTITVFPPEYRGKGLARPVISRENARIIGILLVSIPILIMLFRAKKRKVSPSREDLLEYVGAVG